MTKYPSLTRETFQHYLRVTYIHPKIALLSLLNPIGAMLTNIGVPFFAGRALASIASHNGQFAHNMTIVGIVALLGILANRVGFANLMKSQAYAMDDLGEEVFDHLIERGVGFHANQISGKLISDALDFLNSYLQLSNAAYNSTFSFVLILVSGLVLVSLNSWPLGLFLLVVVTITLSWAYVESNKRTELRHARLEANKNVTAHLSDTIVNAQTVKMFAAEEREKQENKKLNRILFRLRVRDWRRAAISGNNRVGALLLMLIVLLLLINHLSANDPNVLGAGIFAFTYTFTLVIRLFDINTLTRQIEEAFLQASPMTQIMLQQNEIKDVPHAPKLAVTKGAITLHNLLFQYTDGQSDQHVFTELNLSIQPGEKIGLVGPSGGGKSTLTKLLLRLEDIQSGEITIDGQNIATVTQVSLRDNVGYVPQEPLLFHRSIFENIAYGKQNATTQDVAHAAQLAHADEFIKELPQGYDTVVGERGIKLSGGQRQRVAIARALLKDAPILILDEATSALDSESEKYIQAALSELLKKKTAIVIAHRLSTIQRMDRIIVLDAGKVVEEGSHTELLKQKGLYAKLWSHQSGGFLEE